MTMQEKASQLGWVFQEPVEPNPHRSAIIPAPCPWRTGVTDPLKSANELCVGYSYALFGCSPSAGGYIGGCNPWAGSTGNSGCAKQNTSATCESERECYWVTRDGKPQCLSTGGLDANAQDGPAVRNEIQRKVMQSTRLKIPASFYGETTHCGGARGTTVFPMPCSQGSTWNKSLVGAIAAANALELRSAGGDQALSPILQVATDPRFGRLEGVCTITVMRTLQFV